MAHGPWPHHIYFGVPGTKQLRDSSPTCCVQGSSRIWPTAGYCWLVLRHHTEIYLGYLPTWAWESSCCQRIQLVFPLCSVKCWTLNFRWVSFLPSNCSPFDLLCSVYCLECDRHFEPCAPVLRFVVCQRTLFTSLPGALHFPNLPILPINVERV